MALGKQHSFDPEGGEEEAIFAEINITPLTDLFLVMLIIFMVSASVAVDTAQEDKKKLREKSAQLEEVVEKATRSGIKINLPSGEAQEIDPVKATLVVAIALNGEIRVNERVLSAKELDQVFQSAFARDKMTQVVLKADVGVKHGRVVGVMERAKRVGLTRLAIATRGK